MLIGPLQKAEINVMRKEEPDVLIAQVLPYGATLSSTGSPGLWFGGGLYIEGLFCEIHLGNSSLVCLVIVLFITFGLPPLHRLIHGPFPAFSLSVVFCRSQHA